MAEPDANDALKRAISKGNVDDAIELVEGGAPVNTMDLYAAVAHRWPRLVAAMVKVYPYPLAGYFNLQPTLEIARILLDAGHVDLDEALAECVTGDREVATFLMQRGADPAAVIGGSTCLHRAIERDSVETYEWLISRGVPEAPRAGESLMHLARSAAMIDLLAKRGHPVDEIDTHGQSPLHRVSELMRHEAREELLRRGADPTRRDSQGRTCDEILSAALDAESSRPH